jgi:hypothetical protein
MEEIAGVERVVDVLKRAVGVFGTLDVAGMVDQFD